MNPRIVRQEEDNIDMDFSFLSGFGPKKSVTIYISIFNLIFGKAH